MQRSFKNSNFKKFLKLHKTLTECIEMRHSVFIQFDVVSFFKFLNFFYFKSEPIIKGPTDFYLMPNWNYAEMHRMAFLRFKSKLQFSNDDSIVN